MPKICPDCNKKFRDNDKFCPHCRTTLITLSDKDSLIGRVIEDRFTIEGKLGSGGMGAVYRARQHSLDKDVALKVMKRELTDDLQTIKRFLREAKATSRLDHPNTIRVFDFGQTEENLLFIAMELLTGKSLRDVLNDEGRLTLDRAVNILYQVCDSLAEAHDKGMIHRDLKPENIFLTKVADNPDFVKVLDFGIAKVMVSDQSGSLTKTGQIFGTPHYMSPEQAKGHELDLRSDIYSLGVILFEMITGERPFEGDVTPELLIRIISEPVPPMSRSCPELKIPAGIENFIHRMMSKDPADRPQTARSLKNELKLILEGGETITYLKNETEPVLVKKKIPVRETADSPEIKTKGEEPDTKKSSKTRFLYAGGIIMIVAGISIIAYLLFSGSRTDDSQTIALPVEKPDRKAVSEPKANIPVTGQEKVNQEPAKEQINAKILSQPAGALVFENGNYVGTTPFTLKHDKGFETAVELRMDNYQKKIQKISFLTDTETMVVLEKIVTPVSIPIDKILKPEPPKKKKKKDIFDDL